MEKFYDLIGIESRFPGADAVKEMEVLVNRSAIHLWKIGDEIDHPIPRCLMGVAEWMHADMKLLDEVNAWLHQSETNRQSIWFDVFNFSESCLKQEDLDQYVPGLNISQIYHSPVVGYWVDGKLLWSDADYDAKQRVRKLLE